MVTKRHLGVYGIAIINNKILLIKKARGAYIGKYDLPGGSIEHGETPTQTLKREFIEETGVVITSYKLFDVNSFVVNWKHHNEIENMHHIGIIYKVKLKCIKVKNDSDGLDSLGAIWLDINNLNKNNLTPLAYESLLLMGYKV